jgi:integrase
MATQAKRLSARFVETVTEPGMHADGGGLYLNVSPKGAKRWVLIYFVASKRRELSLGSHETLTLAKARDKAAEGRALGDPIAAREQAEAKARAEAEAAEAAPQRTFGVFAEELVKALAPGFRNAKHLDQWRSTLSIEREKDKSWRDSGYCIALRSKPIDTIGTEDVLGVLQPIWNSKAETASRLRGRIERVLDAAKAKGFRSGENPARWRGHLDALLPKRRKLTRGHHAAIPYADVPALVGKLREAQGVGALGLEFAILNASRTGEVIGAKWSEIDRANELWVIPKERMKAGREHRVPLTRRSLEILDALAETRTSDFVFPGNRPRSGISNMTLAKALETAGAGAFTVHGMRSAFRDWVGEETGYPEALAEQALAHIVGDATERAYRRGDALVKRRKLMEAWAAYVEPKAENLNVVPLASQKAKRA